MSITYKKFSQLEETSNFDGNNDYIIINQNNKTKKIKGNKVATSSGNTGSGAVTSVNGKTGNVQLTASDVNALPNTTKIPTIPSALKNPEKLIFNGAVSGVYDGSSQVTVTIPSGGNGSGADGGYYIPSVSEDGILSWTASQNNMAEAPASVNIKGQKGDKGNAAGHGWGSIAPSGDTTGVQDRTAINNALNKASCDLYLPAGIYYIDQPINIPTTCKRLWIHGDASRYERTEFYEGANSDRDKINLAANTQTIIIAKFNTTYNNKFMFNLETNVRTARIENITFLNQSGDELTSGIYGYRISNNNLNDSTVESSGKKIIGQTSSRLVGGIHFYRPAEVTHCSFIGFSKEALHGDKYGSTDDNPQHAEIASNSFYRCKTAIEIDCFDIICRNLWVCSCENGIRFTDMDRGQMQKITGCWFDQMAGDVIYGEKGFGSLQVNDTWVDLIGGHFINVDISKTNSERAYSTLLITGCRINRTNIAGDSNSASIDAYNLRDSIIIVDSQDSFNNYECKPLIKVSGNFENNVIICPRRENILSAIPSKLNFIIDCYGQYESMGNNKFINGLCIRTLSSAPSTATKAPRVGSQIYHKGQLYICTNISGDNYTWEPLLSTSANGTTT